MCGILYTDNRSISKPLFLKTLKLMHHRGPDTSNYYQTLDGVLFGHNRLKILDLDDRSNQPFWSHDERYIIIFNGEIYNYQELARQFNIKQKTTSDTELLIELYDLMGPKMLDYLNGMFAIVILDTLTNDLFVARDRLGIKPLYIAKSGKNITLASEIAAIINLMGKIKFDEIGTRQYRKLRTFFNGHTMYSGVKLFPAGHYMFNGKIQRYWELPQGEQSPPDDEELYELLKTSVNYRCISDVPIGSFLSGGLDSTIIAALAMKPHTWTVGFINNNEFKWAKLVAEHLHFDHSQILIDEKEFLSLAGSMIQKRKEPLSVPNEILIYKMTRSVKEKNTVILSGEGADELFFGYDRIFNWAMENEWDIKQFDKLYSYGSNDDIEILEDILAPFMSYGKTIDIVAAFFQIAHLHGLLRRLDNATMLCSVEARVPFVDHRLVERMAGVPFEYRMNSSQVKAPLKRLFNELIPEEIIKRQKIGFPVPLHQIPFPNPSDGTPMDHWLEFNLKELEHSI